MKQKKIIVTDVKGTPFDDVFRTLLERCQKLIIPVINEVFRTDYTMDEEITLISNEHYFIESDGKSVKRVTDSCIKVGKRLYHIECESSPKRGMAIRMIEYDFHIALANFEIEDDNTVLRFPESAVIYLRHNSKAPDRLNVKLIMPDGNKVNYSVPVVKLQKYTKDEIIDKNLLFFIPYYVLRFEKKLNSNKSKDIAKHELLEDYREIYNRLKSLEELESIDYNYLYDLVNLTVRLIEVVSKNDSEIMSEVSYMGGGKVLEMESEKIYNRGISEGISQGISQGISIALLEILKERGEVSDELKDIILSQEDRMILQKWIILATSVSSVEEFKEKM